MSNRENDPGFEIYLFLQLQKQKFQFCLLLIYYKWHWNQRYLLKIIQLGEFERNSDVPFLTVRFFLSQERLIIFTNWLR